MVRKRRGEKGSSPSSTSVSDRLIVHPGSHTHHVQEPIDHTCNLPYERQNSLLVSHSTYTLLTLTKPTASSERRRRIRLLPLPPRRKALHGRSQNHHTHQLSRVQEDGGAVAGAAQVHDRLRVRLPEEGARDPQLRDGVRRPHGRAERPDHMHVVRGREHEGERKRC